jgi:PST family polysaccharide transporter
VVANQLAMPIMAELQTDPDAMRAKFLRGLRLVTLITIPLCIGMALVAPDLIAIVLTDKWLPAVPVLQVLCIYALIRSVDTLLPPVLLARYRVTYLFWWTVRLLVVMPAAFWVGARWSGALGVALAWVLVYPFLTAQMARTALRELELSWKNVWDEVRPFVGASLVMAVVVFAVCWSIPGTHSQTRLARLCVAAGLGILVYGFGIFRHGGPAFSEVTEVAGWIFRRNHPLTTSK